MDSLDSPEALFGDFDPRKGRVDAGETGLTRYVMLEMCCTRRGETEVNRLRQGRCGCDSDARRSASHDAAPARIRYWNVAEP